MSTIKWHLKQLVPMTYRSHYRDKQDRPRFAVWKMWLGRCYKRDEIIINH